MTSTPNNVTFNMSDMEGSRTGRILVSGTLSYVVVDEEQEGFNPDSWSLWSDASTIPIRDNLRDEANKENYSTAVNVGESDRMEAEVVESDDDEHQVTLKEILSNNLNNTTVNIEDEPMVNIEDEPTVNIEDEPEIEPEPEKPEVVIESVRHFNVQRVIPWGMELSKVYKDPKNVEEETTSQCGEKLKQMIKALKREKPEPKETATMAPK